MILVVISIHLDGLPSYLFTIVLMQSLDTGKHKKHLGA